ncbi:MAG TPA: ATP-binding protein [Baekduia sp.]|uniref:ATP-binding protein n=1 Tax=Baekduia sp. TaxID=2600305 RepID=UPI002BE30B7A|nr:ATP-binding protein [Baekduia sp.]HMJ33813.1 ATP-binding protein [Baekduia sp.]
MARTCPFSLCDGSGILVDEDTRTSSFCRCRDQVVAERQAKGLRAVIPKLYAGSSWDRYPVPQINQAAVYAVRRYTSQIDERLDQGEGLWMFGGHGTGKTTLAMLVSKAAISAGHSVAIYSLPRLLAEIRRTFDEGSPITQTQLIDQLTAVDLLHIDDVGAESTSPWVLEQLYAIVNARYEAKKAIVVTTNLNEREELAEQIGARTVSRLEEMCEVLPVTGADLRRKTYDLVDEPDPVASPVTWDRA